MSEVAPSSAPTSAPASTPATSAPSPAPSHPASIDAQGSVPASNPEPDWSYKIKTKAMGQEREVSLAELRDLAPLGLAAQSKMQEAAKLRKEAEQVKAQYARLQQQVTTPQGARELLVNLARQAGADPNAILRSILEEEIRYSQMSPEQQRQAQIEEENRRYRQTEQQRRAEWEQQQAAQQERAMYAQRDKGVQASIEASYASLPNEVKEELHELALDEIEAAHARGERVTYRLATQRAAQHLDMVSTKRAASLSFDQKIALLTPEERSQIASQVAKEQAARNPQPVAQVGQARAPNGQFTAPQKQEYSGTMGLVDILRAAREGR